MYINNVSKKNLLFVIPSFMVGGAEGVMSTLISKLNKEKYKIYVVVFRKEGQFLNRLPSNIQIFDLKRKHKWDFFILVFRLRRLLKELKPDCMVSFLQRANVISILANLFLKNKTKVIISERGYYDYGANFLGLKYLIKPVVSYLYKKADYIITVATAIKKLLVEEFGILAEKVKIIYNPVDITRIESLSNESVAHPFYQYQDNSFIIIGVGSFKVNKRFDILLEAFAKVCAQVNAFLIIIGEGKLLESLKKKTSNLGLNAKVDFIGFQDNPYKWMGKSDIFVLSSDRGEGLPNVILEAMACGLPVVSTNALSGPSEIIKNGKDGILVEINNPIALSEAIVTVLKNNELRKSLSESGKLRVQDFRLEKMIENYENLFDEC